MNLPFFILLIFISSFWMLLYYIYNPVLRPNSTKSVIISIFFYIFILFASNILYEKLITLNYLNTRFVKDIAVFIGLLSSSLWASYINPWLFRRLDAPKDELAALKEWIAPYGYDATIVGVEEHKAAVMCGISRSHPLIGVNRDLVERMSKEDVTAMLLHEVGHARRSHILIVSLISIVISFIGFRVIDIRHLPYGFLTRLFFVSSYAGLTAICVYYCMYFLEYDADLFAARRVGQTQYISMLKNLDQYTEGLLTKGDPLHPKLEKRIRNVEKNIS